MSTVMMDSMTLPIGSKLMGLELSGRTFAASEVLADLQFPRWMKKNKNKNKNKNWEYTNVAAGHTL